MDIVIITNYAKDFSTQDNSRFAYIANMLSKSNNIEVITSDYFHIEKKHRNQTKEPLPFNVSFIHEPGYKKNICLKRFLSHLIWGQGVYKYLLTRKKPDIVYCAVPSLFGTSKALRYCKKNGIPSIIDIQDLWPEAFYMVFNIPIISKIVFFPFEKLANSIYKKTDAIIAVSETYAKRAIKCNVKNSNYTVVYLGTELEKFDKVTISDRYLKKESNEYWLTYCGTLGSSYDIKPVIDALNIVNHNREQKIRFIVIGNGPLMDAFKEYSERKCALTTFTGYLDYDVMCELLKESDIVINPIVHNSAASIINKHADYAACGRPVINTQESDEYRELVDEYKMGFNCKVGDVKDIAEKISILIDNPELRIKMGKNSRKCAIEKFDRKITYQSILNVINRFKK